MKLWLLNQNNNDSNDTFNFSHPIACSSPNNYQLSEIDDEDDSDVSYESTKISWNKDSASSENTNSVLCFNIKTQTDNKIVAKNLPKIYGTDLVRIESRGSIDPARTIAVKSARPNKGGFGKFLSNLLGQGGAYRPSDTIFPADGTSPPVSDGGQPVNGNWNTLKNSVEEGVDYLVSDHPIEPNKFGKFANQLLNGLAKGNNPEIGRAHV